MTNGPTLDQIPIHATVTVSDLDRARSWYEEKLDKTDGYDIDVIEESVRQRLGS